MNSLFCKQCNYKITEEIENVPLTASFKLHQLKNGDLEVYLTGFLLDDEIDPAITCPKCDADLLGDVAGDIHFTQPGRFI